MPEEEVITCTHTQRDEEDIITGTERGMACLDTWLVVSEDGSVKTKVYLHFSSNHPFEHKMKTLMTDTVVSDERDNVEEKSHVKKALTINSSGLFTTYQ